VYKRQGQENASEAVLGCDAREPPDLLYVLVGPQLRGDAHPTMGKNSVLSGDQPAQCDEAEYSRDDNDDTTHG